MELNLKKVKSFVIDRSKWAQQLFFCDGQYCALGKYLSECGIPDDDLLGHEMPKGLPNKYFSFLREAGLLDVNDDSDAYGDSSIADDIIEVNDEGHDGLTRVRENVLKQLFKDELDVELTFK